jgi:hypothetical protein
MSKTINLAAVMLRPSLMKPEQEMNVSKGIGDAIYNKSHSIAELRFGERLYDSEGPVEVSDEEITMIKAVLTDFPAWVQEPVLKLLGE